MTEVKKKSDTDEVEVEVIRSIGYPGRVAPSGILDMAEAGETVFLPRERARQLQDVGAVKVKI